MDVKLEDGMAEQTQVGFVAPQVPATPAVSKTYVERLVKAGEKLQEDMTREVDKHIEEVVEAEMSHEVRAKVPPTPYTPSVAERKAHEATHCPFRAWCSHCVAGKALERRHYVVQSIIQWIDQLGLVRAELKCDQEPSTVDMVDALVRRCKSTILIPMPSPKGSKGSLGRGERGHLSIQGQLRTLRLATSSKYKITIGPTHILMPWMTRHCS